MNSLAGMYEEGRGVAKDPKQALEWLLKSAEKGDTNAMTSLAWMYEMGRGVPKDLAASYLWFSLADAEGDENAKELRDLLAPDLTPEQIAEAQRRARQWQAKRKKE